MGLGVDAILWSNHMPTQNGSKRVLFDASKDGQNIAPKYVAPEEEQEPYESRRSVPPFAIGIPLSSLVATDYGRSSRKPSKHEIWKLQQRPRVQSKMHSENSVEDARNAGSCSLRSILTCTTEDGNQSSRTFLTSVCHLSAYPRVKHPE